MEIAKFQHVQASGDVDEVLTDRIFFWTPDGVMDLAVRITHDEPGRIGSHINPDSRFTPLFTGLQG